MMPKRAKYAIAITLYLAVLVGSYLHFRHILYWDIHRAIRMGNIERFRLLIECRPRLVNELDSGGCTVLHNVIVHLGPAMELDMYTDLLEKGADINAKDYAARTPLHLAVSRGGKTAVEFLITNGASVNAQDNSKCSPLAYAAHFRGNTEILKLLIDAGADVNQRIVYGGNVLHYLLRSRRDDQQVYNFLLDNGADINAKDSQGKTPLDIARQRKLSGVADLLISRGAIESVQ